MSQRLATAEWADPETYAKEHAYEEGKFWLGRSPLNGQPLGYVDDRHICLVSGTRAGKGTTSIINNLCLWPGSVVVVDPKGENATVTAARRGKGSEHCEGMGQAVHVLDPFNAAQVDDSLRSRFNPLDALDPNDPITIDEAGRVADAIVVMNPESKDPFWDQSARTLVKGLILHVLTAPQFEGRRNLVTIRRLIARGDHEGIATLKEMGETDLPSAQALLWEGVAQNNTFNGVVAGIGDSMVNMAVNASKQFESVLQVANRNTEFLDSPGMQACLETSDFKLSDLKTDPKGVSVYLSLPQRYMGEHFRWLRMMITLAMTEMEATKGQPATGHRVLMCLDEFAGLKRMEVIENAVAQIAGYGVKLFFVLQSLEQLKATYKDNWETFLSNAGLKIFFGIDDHFTREYVSKFIGETELLRELGTSTNTVNQQTTQSRGSSSSSSWNQQESTGVSFSDNWKAMPFFLRNTAGLLAAVTGKRQASRSDNTNTAKSDGGSDGTQSTEATADGTSTALGTNENLQKRPLITPDEIGQHFGRIDDQENSNYPGLGLVLLTGQKPGIVQRGNYFEEETLQRCYQPHPDHPGDRLVRTVQSLAVVHTPFGEWKVNQDGTATDMANRLMWMTAPVGMTWDGQSWVGKPEMATWKSMTVRFGRGVEAYHGSSDGMLYSVINGCLKIAKISNGYTHGQESISFAGHSGWRLPTLDELATLTFNERINCCRRICENEHGESEEELIERLYKRLFPEAHKHTVWAATPIGTPPRSLAKKIYYWLSDYKQPTYAWQLPLGDLVIWDVGEDNRMKTPLEAGALLVRGL